MGEVSAKNEGMSENEKYLKALNDLLSFEIKKLEDNRNWINRHAIFYKTRFKSIRIPIIVLGITLPFLVALQSSYPNFIALAVTSSAIALSVAILTGLDGFYRYGDACAEELSILPEFDLLTLEVLDKKTRLQRYNSTEERIGKTEELLDYLRSGLGNLLKKTSASSVEHVKEMAAAKIPSQK